MSEPTPIDLPAPRVLQDQVFQAVSVEPYCRKDGGQTHLVTWRSRCPTCNAGFETVTPIAGAFEPTRRCDEHRQPGTPVSRRYECRHLIDATPRQPVDCEPRKHVAAISLIDVGALALVTIDHELVDTLDMPAIDGSPRVRPYIDAVRFAAILRAWQPVSIVIEVDEIRSSDTALVATAQGHARGLIDGIAAAFESPLWHMPTTHWRRLVDLPINRFAKNAARYAAVAAWPMHAEWFQHPMGDIRGEAALLAVAGLMSADAGERF